MLQASGSSSVVVAPESEDEVRFGQALDALLRQMGLHDIVDGRLRLLNPKALVRLADYYDAPLRKAPLL